MKIFLLVFLFSMGLLLLFTPYSSSSVKNTYYVRSQKHEIPPETIFASGAPLALKKQVVEKLVDTLRTAVEVFEEKEVEYWLTGHLLHGAVLVKGLLPWDDTAVVAVKYSSMNKLISCRASLEKRGYTLLKHKSGFRVSRRQLVELPAIEIVLVDQVKKELVICSPLDDLNMCTFADSFMRRNEINTEDAIFPLQKLAFEDFFVACPRDPHVCLRTFYSTTDLDVVQTQTNSIQTHIQNSYALRCFSKYIT